MKNAIVKGPGKIRLVYILAASHSGSTLLAMLLGSHSDICTVGELKATSLGDTDRYLCSCRRKIKECPFWTGITRDMAERGYEFDITNSGTDIRNSASPYVRKLLNPLHRGPFLEKIRDTALDLSPNWRKQLPKIQAANTMLMECILAQTGKKIIVDSSKIGIRLKYLMRNKSLDVKIIRLIRDGRGVALTYMDPERFADASDQQFRGGGTGDNRAKERPMIEAAREWRRSNEEAEAILRHVDQERWLEIRYEDLCAKGEKTMPRLLRFIGVDSEKMPADFRNTEHHVVGNGMRLDSSNEIRLDERWKTTLNGSDLKIFESVAGELNRRLGYH